MGSANKRHALKPDVAQLRKLIESSLLADWVIRIEYSDGKSATDPWQQWDQAVFAIRSADDVLAAIMDCYAKNMNCSIRMNAEKVRPQTRMLFTVCRHQPLPADVEVKPEHATFPYLGDFGYIPGRPGLVTQS